jgi:hypothetical protein
VFLQFVFRFAMDLDQIICNVCVSSTGKYSYSLLYVIIILRGYLYGTYIYIGFKGGQMAGLYK